MQNIEDDCVGYPHLPRVPDLSEMLQLMHESDYCTGQSGTRSPVYVDHIIVGQIPGKISEEIANIRGAGKLTVIDSRMKATIKFTDEGEFNGFHIVKETKQSKWREVEMFQYPFACGLSSGFQSGSLENKRNSFHNIASLRHWGN